MAAVEGEVEEHAVQAQTHEAEEVTGKSPQEPARAPSSPNGAWSRRDQLLPTKRSFLGPAIDMTG
jgi:hypothetical protein